MATANDILTIARGEIGYREGRNNDSKYGAAYGMNFNPWCVMFVWWCFQRANAGKLFYGGNRTALCSTLYNYHKGVGQSVGTSALRAGDIVFFDFSGRKQATNHVGIVESVTGSMVTTIEGNTSSSSSGSQSNGDGVYRRQRRTSVISCAYRPAYDGATQMPAADTRIDTVREVQTWLNASCGANLVTDNIYGPATRRALICTLQRAIGTTADGVVGPKTRAALPIIRTGSRGTVVRVAQAFLVCRGYRSAYVDGEFGDDTKAAVIAFQKAYRLNPDGVIGKNTWRKLIG